MISLARLRGDVSFPFFSSLGELVQGSALVWLWLHLGSTFLLVVEPDSWRGVWAGEDGLGDDCPWGRELVFVWAVVYSMEGLWSWSKGLVLGSTLFWPILPLWPTLSLEGGAVPFLGGGGSVWVSSGGVIFIWAQVFSRDGSDSLLVKLVQGSTLFWPYPPQHPGPFISKDVGHRGSYGQTKVDPWTNVTSKKSDPSLEKT